MKPNTLRIRSQKRHKNHGGNRRREWYYRQNKRDENNVPQSPVD